MAQTNAVITVPTSPFDGQKPGTSGLRKPVSTFMQPKYTENFVQSILDVALDGLVPKDVTLVIGGDGRYFSKTAIDYIVAICAANGVSLPPPPRASVSGNNGSLLLHRLADCWSLRMASCPHLPCHR